VSSRIGRGPWARALGAALVPDDATPEAIRGEELWRRGAVEELRIERGQISTRAEECAVTITAPTIRPRVWDAVASYSRNRGPLAEAVRGDLQSAQLAHLLDQDWEDPLIPEHVVTSCGCDGAGSCVHVVAAAYALAAAVDADPGVLLRWRGALPSATRTRKARRRTRTRGAVRPCPRPRPSCAGARSRSSSASARRAFAPGGRTSRTSFRQPTKRSPASRRKTTARWE
jgi:uncharacterized Zn finger protein